MINFEKYSTGTRADAFQAKAWRVSDGHISATTRHPKCSPVRPCLWRGVAFAGVVQR